MQKTSDEPRASRGLLGRVIFIGTLVPILYVLGIGPAFRFLPVNNFRALYLPRMSFGMQIPPIDHFLDWYMEKVWGCDIGPHVFFRSHHLALHTLRPTPPGGDHTPSHSAR